jgi:hypothetical protein
VIFYLENTSYQEFDAWLSNKAGKYGFYISYDPFGLIDDKGDILSVPKSEYPLRIYLSKIYPNGRSYDNDGLFIVEKVGSGLQICPKVFSKRGKNHLDLILKEIWDGWPQSKQAGKSTKSTEDNGHWAYSPDKRHEIIEAYKSNRENIKNKDAWAQNNYGICGRTLSNYLKSES